MIPIKAFDQTIEMDREDLLKKIRTVLCEENYDLMTEGEFAKLYIGKNEITKSRKDKIEKAAKVVGVPENANKFITLCRMNDGTELNAVKAGFVDFVSRKADRILEISDSDTLADLKYDIDISSEVATAIADYAERLYPIFRVEGDKAYLTEFFYHAKDDYVTDFGDILIRCGLDDLEGEYEYTCITDGGWNFRLGEPMTQEYDCEGYYMASVNWHDFLCNVAYYITEAEGVIAKIGTQRHPLLKAKMNKKCHTPKEYDVKRIKQEGMDK